jgi:hypothetical protein
LVAAPTHQWSPSWRTPVISGKRATSISADGAVKRCFIDGSKVMPPDKTLAESSALKAALAAPTDSARWYLNAYTGKSSKTPGFRRSLQSTLNATGLANLGDAALTCPGDMPKSFPASSNTVKVFSRREQRVGVAA